MFKFVAFTVPTGDATGAGAVRGQIKCTIHVAKLANAAAASDEMVVVMG
jgi:hypothetical protein